MSYIVVDPVIKAWSERHSFLLFTLYKDSEVRSVNVVSETGRKFQIWIDHPKGDQISVHVWNYKKQRQDWEVNVADLNTALEEAASTVREWDIA